MRAWKLKTAALLVVTVALLPRAQAAPPVDTEREQAWAELASADSARALRALFLLTHRPDDLVPFAAERLSSLLAGEVPADVARLIDDLDSPQFATRDRACSALEERLEHAAPFLQKTLNRRPSLEVTRRLEILLSRRKATDALLAQRLQAARGMALLRHLDTPAARRALQALTEDGKESWIVTEARAALVRLTPARPQWTDLVEADAGTVAASFLVLTAVPSEDRAAADEIRAALAVALDVPPLSLPSNGVTALRLPHDLLPYRKSVLKAYAAPVELTSFRKAVRAALRALNEEAKDFVMEEEFLVLPADRRDREKVRIEEVQKHRVADSAFRLGKAVEELETWDEARNKEGKLWQANYDYVLARLHARQASLIAYNLALGQLRRDILPPLDQERHKGWRLEAHGNIGDKDGRDLQQRALKLLRQVAEEHPGTPWALIAYFEANTPLGLQWVPLAR